MVMSSTDRAPREALCSHQVRVFEGGNQSLPLPLTCLMACSGRGWRNRSWRFVLSRLGNVAAGLLGVDDAAIDEEPDLFIGRIRSPDFEHDLVQSAWAFS